MTDSLPVHSQEPIDDTRFNCPKWTGVGPPGVHYWCKRDVFRRCSHCGSVHPDDWIDAVQESIRTGGDIRISTGKRGKWYVDGRTEKGVTTHGKFYGGHMPADRRQDLTLSNELRRAIRISWRRAFGSEKDAVEHLGDLVRDEQPRRPGYPQPGT